MQTYQNLLQHILDTGYDQNNRTGVQTRTVPGAHLSFDLAEGFPAVTTKKLFFKAVVAELLGFIRGYDSAAQFRELGCRVWDKDANENGDWLKNKHRQGQDDLGRIYGVQWRRWAAPDKLAPRIDQLAKALDLIQNNPTNRRIIVSAWNPADLDKCALPPCHVLFQFLVNTTTNELNLCMYQRSADSFLGVPFNIASYALLLSLVAKATNLTPRHLNIFLADAHIYHNHFDQVKELLSRKPFAKPQLAIGRNIQADENPASYLESLVPEEIWLYEYVCHPPILAEMSTTPKF